MRSQNFTPALKSIPCNLDRTAIQALGVVFRMGDAIMIFGESSERKSLEQQRRSEGRLPPGQSLTLKWPVLHYGSVPHVDLRTWDFRIDGLVEKPVRLTWEEFNRL